MASRIRAVGVVHACLPNSTFTSSSRPQAHGFVCQFRFFAGVKVEAHAKNTSVELLVSVGRVRDVVAEIVESWGRDGLCDSLGESPAIALDCEGVQLGRFGRVCLMQVAMPDGRCLLVDALRPGLVEAWKPVLESPNIPKAMHDCREDSAALYHQHGILLQAVFDTQVAHSMLVKRTGGIEHQASAAALLGSMLGLSESPELSKVKELMRGDAKLWSRRPLTSLLVSYALHGVVNLLPLRRALLDQSQDFLPEVLHASDCAVQYCYLNREFATAESMAKIGTQLWALLTARTSGGLYFKLNAGRIGLASTPSAIHRFRDVNIGDVVLCCVSGLNINGAYIYLDRYDHDWDYFDHQLRPSPVPEIGVYGREHRHESSLFVDTVNSGIDPLLSRGLPNAESIQGANNFDMWEAEPEDLGLQDED